MIKKTIVEFIIGCAILVLFILIFWICVSKNTNSENKAETLLYKEITIDSCEYIMYHSIYNTQDDKLVHKGNCKYCQYRLEKTIQKELKSTK